MGVVHEVEVGVAIALVTGAGGWVFRRYAMSILRSALNAVPGHEGGQMKYERTFANRDWLNAHVPRIKGNIGQGVHRSNVFNGLMAGLSPDEARTLSITTVRRYIPDFTPVEY